PTATRRRRRTSRRLSTRWSSRTPSCEPTRRRRRKRRRSKRRRTHRRSPEPTTEHHAFESIATAVSRGVFGRCLFAASLLAAQPVLAADDPAVPIPWAYSAYFGTGVYEVQNGEKAYVFQTTPDWTWHEASVDEHGRRTIGFKFKFPVALGAHDLDAHAIGSTLSLDNVSTLTVVPGVEADIPIGPRWSLRPFAAV